MFESFLKIGGSFDRGLSLIFTMFNGHKDNEVQKAQLAFAKLCENELREAFERHSALWYEGPSLTEEQKQVCIRSFHVNLRDKWLPSLEKLAEKIANHEFMLGSRPILSTEALLTAAMQIVARHIDQTLSTTEPPIAWEEAVPRTPCQWYVDLATTTPEMEYGALVEFAIRIAKRFADSGIDVDFIASESVDIVISSPKQPERLKGMVRRVMCRRCIDAVRKQKRVTTISWSVDLEDYAEDREESSGTAVSDILELFQSAREWFKEILGGAEHVDRSLLIASVVDNLKPRNAAQNVFHVCGTDAISTVIPSHRLQSVRERFETKLKARLKEDRP